MSRAIVVGLMLGLGGAAVVAQDAAPTWAKPDAFWYRKAVTGGHVWVTVDAAVGVRQSLFDHKRLAIELSQKSGYEFTDLTLPFVDPAARFVVKYDGSSVPVPQGLLAIEFILADAQWRCELQAEWDWGREPPSDYECTKRDGPPPTAAIAAAIASRVSPDRKWEAFVQSSNVMVRPAGASTGATALSQDGTDAFAYDPASIQWSADSKTVSAYRVDAAIWRAAELSGNVTSMIVKGTWSVRSGR
ncbi:MAG TPA: hypothetical protein VFV98_17905 [Vicinamibacterales bacterium]|nr:hypothetical protein [Vicinamibacterales bacterium]